MKSIYLSINPSYLCNLRCSFCYLTKKQLGDKTKVALETIEKHLVEIKKHREIVHVDLYGGELAMLDQEWLYTLKDTITTHCPDAKLNVITNYTRKIDFFHEEDIDLSVSFDFEARKRYEQVFQNIMASPKDIHVLVLASKRLLKISPTRMIKTFNACSRIKSVEIKPYSSNQSNQHAVSDEDFEQLVKAFITSPIEKKFQFINKDRLDRSVDLQYNAFSDDHLYIFPSGSLGVLEFDGKDEYFKDLDSFDDYLIWCAGERDRVTKSKICSECNYLGHCATEHYRDVTSLEHSCSGYYKLLEWWKDERHNF